MDEVARPRLGFIGLGRMGLPMCRNLLAAGFPLTIHTRTAARAAGLSDTTEVVASPGAVAQRAPIVAVCVDSVDATREIFLGPGGLLSAAVPGTILIDHGTNGPELARALHQRGAERGVEVMDAPLSGGPEGAAAGRLTVFAGGSAATLARVEAILRVNASTIHHLGPAGAGAVAKLINQLLTATHAVVAAEALSLAAAAGLPLAALLEALATGFGQSRMLERTGARVLTANWEAGAALRLFLKDLEMVRRLAAATGTSLATGSAAAAVITTAVENGQGSDDLAALAAPRRSTGG